MLRGYVYNENNQALPSVNVRVMNTGLGTITNQLGQYELRLEQGLNRVIYSSIGFETQQIDIVMEGDEVKNIWLSVADNEIEAIDVRIKKRDYSYEIIKNVIENKHHYQEQYNSLKQRIYIKSVEEVESKKQNTSEEEIDEKPDDLIELKDSIPNLHLYETEMIHHFQHSNKTKEEKSAAKKLGDQRTLFYTSTTDGDFDFYKNLIVIRKLGDNSYVSPFSPTTFLSYKFKLLGSYFEGDNKVYRIEMSPRKHGNALLKGTIEVYDKLWALKRVEFEFPKNSLILYQQFSIVQDYSFVDSMHIVTHQEFNWKIKDGQTKINGYCFVKHSDFVFDTIYPKRFFGAELGVTAMDAYEKDSSYWSSIRPVPLSKKEQSFIQYQDSMYLLRHSKVYWQLEDGGSDTLLVIIKNSRIENLLALVRF